MNIHKPITKQSKLLTLMDAELFMFLVILHNTMTDLYITALDVVF